MASHLRDLAVLSGLLAVTLTVGGLGAWATVPEIAGWYHGLQRPSWTPPDVVFGPVWTTLYVLMAIAAWRIWRCPPTAVRSAGLALWWVQLAANGLWSPLFFGLHRVGPALIDIGVLLGLLAACVLAFRRLVPWAGWLMLPYLAWVCYAATLNYGILILNP